MFEASGNVIGTASTDMDPSTADFLGVVSDDPIASFAIAGFGLAIDDLVFTSIATADCTPPTITVTPTPPIVVPATMTTGATVSYTATPRTTLTRTRPSPAFRPPAACFRLVRRR